MTVDVNAIAEKIAASKVVEPEAPKAEVAPTDTVEAKEEPKKGDRKLAKALSEAQKAQSEHMKLKAQFDALSRLVEEAKTDPKKALKLANTDFETLAKKAIAGEFRADDGETPLDPKDMKVKELEERLSSMEKEKVELVVKQEKEWLKGELSKADEFALAASFPWAVDTIYKLYYDQYAKTGEVPNTAAVVREFQDQLFNDVDNVLSSEAAVKLAIKKNPKLRNTIMSALGIDKTPTANPKQDSKGETQGTRARPSLAQTEASEIPTRTVRNKATPEQRRENALRALTARLEGRN